MNQNPCSQFIQKVYGSRCFGSKLIFKMAARDHLELCSLAENARVFRRDVKAKSFIKGLGIATGCDF